MPETPLPDNLPRIVADLERRLKILETGAPQRFTSMREGTFTIADESGVTMVQLGLLDDGTYGLGILNGSGDFVSIQNVVLGWDYDEVITTEATTSTTATDLATAGPSCTVHVGPTGKVLVTAGAYIGLPAGPVSSAVDLFVDGSLHGAGAIVGSSNGNAAGIAGSHQNSRQVGGLSEGDHTFALKYRSTTGDSINFSSRTLLVQPY